MNFSDISIQFALVEDSDRVVVHPSNTDDLPTRRRSGVPRDEMDLRRPRLKHRPNGRLCVQLDCETDVQGLRRRWCESATVRMEGMLNRVVEGMILLAAGARQVRAEAAARRRAYEDAEAQRAKVAQEARDEQERQKDLTQRMETRRRANEMAAFIAEVEHAAHDQDKLAEAGSPHARWPSWAHGHVLSPRRSTFQRFPEAPPLRDRAPSPREETPAPTTAPRP